MMNASITVDQINYPDLVNLLNSEKSGLLHILLRPFLKGGSILLTQKAKDSLAVKAINYNQIAVLDAINGILKKNNIYAEVSAINAEKISQGIKVNMDLSVNWNQLAVEYYPQLIGLIPEKDNTQLVKNVIGLIDDDAKEIISVISDELLRLGKIELLAEMLITHYRNKICDYLSKLVSEKGVLLQLTGLSVKSL